MNEYCDAKLNWITKCLFDTNILKTYIKLSNILLNIINNISI